MWRVECEKDGIKMRVNKMSDRRRERKIYVTIDGLDSKEGGAHCHKEERERRGS